MYEGGGIGKCGDSGWGSYTSFLILVNCLWCYEGRPLINVGPYMCYVWFSSLKFVSTHCVIYSGDEEVRVLIRDRAHS